MSTLSNVMRGKEAFSNLGNAEHDMRTYKGIFVAAFSLAILMAVIIGVTMFMPEASFLNSAFVFIFMFFTMVAVGMGVRYALQSEHVHRFVSKGSAYTREVEALFFPEDAFCLNVLFELDAELAPLMSREERTYRPWVREGRFDLFDDELKSKDFRTIFFPTFMPYLASTRPEYHAIARRYVRFLLWSSNTRLVLTGLGMLMSIAEHYAHSPISLVMHDILRLDKDDDRPWYYADIVINASDRNGALYHAYSVPWNCARESVEIAANDDKIKVLLKCIEEKGLLKYKCMDTVIRTYFNYNDPIALGHDKFPIRPSMYASPPFATLFSAFPPH